MSDLIPVYLYRMESSGEPYFGTMKRVVASRDVEVIGVAFRQPFDSITGQTSRTRFEIEVEETADEVRWFEGVNT